MKLRRHPHQESAAVFLAGDWFRNRLVGRYQVSNNIGHHFPDTPERGLLVDQGGFEHTNGEIIVTETGQEATSGGELDIEAGDYNFLLRPSIRNVTRDENWRIPDVKLERIVGETVAETTTELVFTWDRAVWNPLVIGDQDEVRHGVGSIHLKLGTPN